MWGSVPPPNALVRLIPNSANCCAANVVPLVPLSSAAIADWLASPSTVDESGVITFEPHQGRLSVFTKQGLQIAQLGQ
jgi:hypothetical protein